MARVAVGRWLPALLCVLIAGCGAGNSSTEKTGAFGATTRSASMVGNTTRSDALDEEVTSPRLEFVAGALGGLGNLDGVGTEARFDFPKGVAIDSVGRRFIVDWRNHVIRKVETDGTVSTFAGGKSQPGAVDAVGIDARFSFPTGIAIDSDDTMYVTDNQTVRRVTPDAVVTTLAGQAYSADEIDGPGAVARFSYPTGIAIDRDKTVYVSDSGGHVIRTISTTGVVTTLAGTPNQRGADDGLGSAARFFTPTALVLDSARNLHVADRDNATLRKITPDGRVTTLAGKLRVFERIDGVGAAAAFSGLNNLTIDRCDTLFAIDGITDTRIRKITLAGEVTTLPVNDPDPAHTGLRVDRLDSIAASADGSLTVTGTYGVYSIARDSAAVDGFADTLAMLAGLVPEFGLVNGSAEQARFGLSAPFFVPYGIAADPVGNVIVADTYNQRIRKITAAGEVTDFAGNGTIGGSADGVGAAAGVSSPRGIVADAAGNIYLADTFNSTIRKITPDGNVTTLAGIVATPGNVDGPANTARFFEPQAIAVDAAGNLFIADTGNQSVRKLSPDGVVTTLARREVGFGRIEGIAVDAAGAVYVSDVSAHVIFKIATDGTVSDIAGGIRSSGSADGVGTQARFSAPRGLAVDASGNVYVADTGNSTIRKIDGQGNVTTVAGSPISTGTRFGALPGSLDHPNAIAIGALGTLLIMNGTNVLRLILPS